MKPRPDECDCQPDQDDVEALDVMEGRCDCEYPGEGCSQYWQRFNSDRCLDVTPRLLIDADDAEDMADLDDPRSLAALEAML